MSFTKITHREVNPLQYVTLSKDINNGLYTYTLKIKLSGDRVIHNGGAQFCKVASTKSTNTEIIEKYKVQRALDNWSLLYYTPRGISTSNTISVHRILSKNATEFTNDTIGKIPALVQYFKDSKAVRVNSASLSPEKLFNLPIRHYDFGTTHTINDNIPVDTNVLRDGDNVYLQTFWSDEKSIVSTYKISVNFNNSVDYEKTGKDITKIVKEYCESLGFTADIKLHNINVTTVDKFYIDNQYYFNKFIEFSNSLNFKLAHNIQKKKAQKKYLYNIFIASRDIENTVSGYARGRLEKTFESVSYNSIDGRTIGTAQIMVMMTDSLATVKKAMFFLPVDKNNRISYIMDVNVFKDDFENIKEVIGTESP